MKDVVILSGTLMAVGSFGGALKTVPVVDPDATRCSGGTSPPA